MKPITWRRVLVTSLLCALAVPIVALAAPQSFTLKAGDTLSVKGQSCGLTVQSSSAAEVLIACVVAAMTPTSTPSVTATSTSTPMPTATATLSPTATSTLVATATATGTPSGGVALCTDHSLTAWHGLVKRDSSGAIACTYEHTHFDDPRSLNSVFGPLPYGEISHPWLTTNENLHPGKHVFYKWVTRTDTDCSSSIGGYGFRRFRVQQHADANTGALGRYHSFLVQAEMCHIADPSYNATISYGGHMDFGSLYVLTNSGDTYVPLAGDAGDTNPAGGPRRLHGSPERIRYDFTWYGQHGLGQMGWIHEDWGPVDPDNLSRQLFYNDPTQNHSWQEALHTIAILTPDNGLGGTQSGYLNRAGQRVADGCTVGPDCIPYSIAGARVGTYHQYRADTGGPTITREYDVKGPDGKSLIRFPN